MYSGRGFQNSTKKWKKELKCQKIHIKKRLWKVLFQPVKVFSCLGTDNFANRSLLTLQNNYSNPYVISGGDLNRRSIAEAIADVPSMRYIDVGPTRGDAYLDVLSSNINAMIVDKGTTSPIHNEELTESDHLLLLYLSTCRGYLRTELRNTHITIKMRPAPNLLETGWKRRTGTKLEMLRQ